MKDEIIAPKKLIEVALPLDDINKEASREKSIRHGHPSTLHLWWARRPLAAARAVLFAQLVNDPGGERGYSKGKPKKKVEQERERLFDIIRDLVKWENTTNEEVLERAREEIRKSWKETCELNKGKPGFDPDKLPAFHDPFAGGGSIPLEAQRLGLEAYASDLNPVAVMINKAMIEIPPKFAGVKPVGPLPAGEDQPDLFKDWPGATGLAEDVRRYGHWMREEAFKRIGYLYPKVEITKEMVSERSDLKKYEGQKLTVIAWLWARTVKSPNPAFSHVDVPLVSSFVLATKKGKEAWIEPIIKKDSWHFKVQIGKYPAKAIDGTKLSRTSFNCLLSNTPIELEYIKTEGMKGKMNSVLMAIVLEGINGRVYITPNDEHASIAAKAEPSWFPQGAVPSRLTGGTCYGYGFTEWKNLFTHRQLLGITTFTDLVQEARTKVITDAAQAGMQDDGKGIDAGGTGVAAYGDALAIYLSFGVDKVTDYWSSICSWHSSKELIRNTFGRQAIPMVWDFAETNPFSDSTGNWMAMISWTGRALINVPAKTQSFAEQTDASSQRLSMNKIIATDPPYYDNIGYADLSDFFYIWMRRSLKGIYPNLFATMTVPKAEELVATPCRHGSKEKAEQFFLNGMTRAMHNLAELSHSAFPVTIFYAFKQAETKEGSTSSTGWETFLEAVLHAGFAINGTWPMRTELGNRMIGFGANALASSIVLVCRMRATEASETTRREFVQELKENMPEALETMIGGTIGQSPVAPVDLAQAAIGPGMAIYSKYKSVFNQDGTSMSVHDALILINQEITEYLSPESGSFDNDTLFCAAWFDQYEWGAGPFGEADTLSRAKGTSVKGLEEAGVVDSGGGKVRLLKWTEYKDDWDPASDNRLPVWEATHYLIRTLSQKGEQEAGKLLAKIAAMAEPIRQLAYHLYTMCERKKWAEEARSYNELVTSWHSIVTASMENSQPVEQPDLDKLGETK